MRIALIVPGGFDPGERVIPVLQNLAFELARKHDVEVFAAGGPSGRARSERDGFVVHQLSRSTNADVPERGRRLLRRGSVVVSLLRALGEASLRGRFDLLHAFWAGDSALAACTLGRALRLPVVVSIGGGEAVWIPAARYGGSRTAIGRAELRATLGLASALTAGSEVAATFLPAGVASSVRIIPLGIRCEEFSATPERPLGPPWRLVHVGDLNLVKDQESLLRAVARVRARGAAVSLDCVGEDTREGALQHLARELGLAAHVTFHGFVPQRSLPDLLRRAHLHVLSSRYESQGVAILEAAAAGLPTVGTAVGLLPTLAPRAARCVAPGDPDALGEAIFGLLLDADARRDAGAMAQQWARAHDAAWTARRFEELYASLVPVS